MNPLRRLDAFHRERPFASDAIVAGLLLLFLVALPYLLLAPTGGMFHVPDSPAWLVTIDALMDAALVSTWAFRRRSPLPAIRTAIALCLVILLIGPDFTLALFVVPMFVHHAAATFSRRSSFTVLGIALAGAVAHGVKNGWFSRNAHYTGFDPGAEAPTIALAMAIPCGAVVLAAWAFGDVARTRLIALRAVEDRARRLEVQAQQERELAAADERNRIAREMHDIVSHSLQVMISQADGARYAAAAKPELAVQTLETISGTGRSALSEMRALLGVLRPSSPSTPAAGTAAAGSPDRSTGSGSPATGAVPASSRTEAAPRHPQPTLEDIGELVDTVRLSGLEVEVERRGVSAAPAAGRRGAGGLPDRPGGVDQHPPPWRPAGPRPSHPGVDGAGPGPGGARRRPGRLRLRRHHRRRARPAGHGRAGPAVRRCPGGWAGAGGRRLAGPRAAALRRGVGGVVRRSRLVHTGRPS